ncbi:SDR family NAD(P)-dependent oxidoreductase [Bailinhaonella thermotolerans]|uniref:SDR family NAD(P)-dependent oxidoreductase n=1 Tax=Bailinhaonella thermotolerans TaxID=1070861 RepID=A0A3A4AX18_9ACTN|nr:SDR family NAD(P)-dependent oxidoreductase [Bailinhaonella thermotolerans]RJL31924.1 SDR family NAD(P)-dependent oxidoreductase [Bailinhaonella thermotolerans]
MTRAALLGRIAIVTGAGPGLGAAVSRALGAAGASLVLAARDGRALAALAAAINAAGGHAVTVPMDATGPASLRRLVEQTLGAFGRLDAAVNHAPARETSLAMTYQIPALRPGGRVVNLSTGPHAPVIALTRAAARDPAASAVLVNTVAAGPYGGAEAVADAVVRLCSGDVPLATGETWHVPGPRPPGGPPPAPGR